MWQFIIGVIVGGGVGFFVAALVMGANADRVEDEINRKFLEEHNQPRND